MTPVVDTTDGAAIVSDAGCATARSSWATPTTSSRRASGRPCPGSMPCLNVTTPSSGYATGFDPGVVADKEQTAR